MLATLPSQVFIFWVIGWQAVDTVRERRIARAAAVEARAAYSSSVPVPPTTRSDDQDLERHVYQPQSDWMDRSANLVSAGSAGHLAASGGMDAHG
jgi:hypothetical protein